MDSPTTRERHAALRELGSEDPERAWDALSDGGRERVDAFAMQLRRHTQKHNAQQRAPQERTSK